MKSRIGTILLVLFLAFLPLASAIEYPTLNGFVTDKANILTPEYNTKITGLAQEIYTNTTVEIAVLTVPTLDGDTIENYAVKTFEKNGIGKKDVDNGLLILVVCCDPETREYRFEVGYGLEGTITDSMKAPIGDRIIVPNFKNGDYGKGIYESMVVVNGLVTNNSEVMSEYGAKQSASSDGVILIIIIIVVVFGILFIVALLNSGGGGGGSGGYSGGGGYHHHSSDSDSDSHSDSGSFGGFGGGSSGGGGFGGKF